MRFSGKTVVITGAASGIGAETARLFAREGAIVYAADIDEAGVSALRDEGIGDIRFQHCDVCSTDAIKALMDRAGTETGGIDVVFNNAGAGGARAQIHEIEPADWDRTMDLLLRSVAFGIRYAVPYMKNRPGASIVNTASVAAEDGQMGQAAYSASKGGVVGMTLPIARDLMGEGIRVNTILPGIFETPLMQGAPQNVKDALAASVPFPKRLGNPAEYAALALLMVENGYFNGEDVRLDGAIRMAPR